METTPASVGRMETQLKQWFEKLDELVAKAEKAGAAASELEAAFKKLAN